ncbi:hypothetical protein PR003_g2026 [Phytophthora rubi]|uniref:Uncharacterized protein n=1 Tax=Phytophthora rubi TaxID=129364 RepID=A0A6A3NNL1_9STRA|nr:hypothetical protein PR001_g5200 [Phytophthora rubi]KAE9356980.1 hypothetical protein PR003_g2026 [Phytophthora rubi]
MDIDDGGAPNAGNVNSDADSGSDVPNGSSDKGSADVESGRDGNEEDEDTAEVAASSWRLSPCRPSVSLDPLNVGGDKLLPVAARKWLDLGHILMYRMIPAPTTVRPPNPLRISALRESCRSFIDVNTPNLLVRCLWWRPSALDSGAAASAQDDPV